MPAYIALPTDVVRAYQAGGPDAFGNPPEIMVSDGADYGCRHCLGHIPAGHEMLLLAHQPFDQNQPYAEVGPLFICREPCERGGGRSWPALLTTSPDYLLKGYSRDNRIVYGTGAVVDAEDIPDYADQLLARDDIAYVHVRSARNNCYQLRIDRDA